MSNIGFLTDLRITQVPTKDFANNLNELYRKFKSFKDDFIAKNKDYIASKALITGKFAPEDAILEDAKLSSPRLPSSLASSSTSAMSAVFSETTAVVTSASSAIIEPVTSSGTTTRGLPSLRESSGSTVSDKTATTPLGTSDLVIHEHFFHTGTASEFSTSTVSDTDDLCQVRKPG